MEIEVITVSWSSEGVAQRRDVGPRAGVLLCKMGDADYMEA